MSTSSKNTDTMTFGLLFHMLDLAFYSWASYSVSQTLQTSPKPRRGQVRYCPQKQGSCLSVLDHRAGLLRQRLRGKARTREEWRGVELTFEENIVERAERSFEGIVAEEAERDAESYPER